jgi:uncharacterized protein YwbE
MKRDQKTGSLGGGLLRRCLRTAGRHHFVLALSRALRSARTGEGSHPPDSIRHKKAP